MVNPCPAQMADMPHGKLNFIDLQLDKTIGIYCARLTGQPEHLVMHGLSTEMLHGLLLQLKAQPAHAV